MIAFAPSRRRTVSVAALMLALLAISAPASAQDDEGPLLEALRLVPSAAAAGSEATSFVDYHAVAAARPGALVPSSLAELLERQAAGDRAADLWFAASMGIASGPGDVLGALFTGGPAWPELVGFDFTQIARAVSFGTPPSNGTVLIGTFDPAAIGAAHAARGYSSTPAGERALWCSQDGCDAGMDADLAARDPRLPFGGMLGRQEPLVVSTSDLLSSADDGVIERMLAAADGSAPSLADAGPFRVVATAPADDLTIIQATLLPSTLTMGGVDPIEMMGASPEEAEALLHELDDLAPLAPPLATAIVDGATPTEQVLTIALAYADEATAAAAADAVVERLASVRSMRRGVPLTDLLTERGVTTITPRVSAPDADGLAAAVVELRAPLADDAPTDSGRPAPSSALYRLFTDLVLMRDMLWMAPSAGPRMTT